MKRLMVFVYIVVAALAVLNLMVRFEPEPDAVFPMANRNIEWYYAGK